MFLILGGAMRPVDLFATSPADTMIFKNHVALLVRGGKQSKEQPKKVHILTGHFHQDVQWFVRLMGAPARVIQQLATHTGNHPAIHEIWSGRSSLCIEGQGDARASRANRRRARRLSIQLRRVPEEDND